MSMKLLGLQFARKVKFSLYNSALNSFSASSKGGKR